MPAPARLTNPDFRLLFEAAPDPYLALAPDLTVVAASDAYLRATGAERAQLLGRRLPDLFHGGREGGFGRALCASLERALASGRADTLEVEEYGLGAPHRAWAAPLRLVNLPIHGAEDEIVYLLHRVEPPTPDAFLAGLAHDLRNPLAPIVNSLHIARLPNVSETQREELRALTERQVQQLTRLVDDLLDVSRLESGKVVLERERLDLAELVRAAARPLSARLAARDLRLTLALPERSLWTLADRGRLTQAVANLLENACACTGPGGEIAVALTAGVAGDGEAVLTVRDTGVGIPPELLPRIFEPFRQGDAAAAGAAGLGLGLALVKSLVEMHGGSVAAASAGPGQGATFTLRLPLAPQRETATSRPFAGRGERGTGEPHRILIVEDNVDAAESLRLFLDLTGHEVVVAHDGPAGVARAHDCQPEVVLCDIGLPGEMDGYAVARVLRSDPELSFIRLIALTGYGQAEDRRLASEAGFDLHLTKPTDPEALLRVLASFF
ncbi:MAG TPA: ATP-binding protein [Thermoanaerobaculia bacterium]|nr:ATP-binding protein [Thermoanaerobaculia bacterium]